ncbi:MAG: aspartate dehydrogenase [Pseudomonadota bacterium]|nr:aspartate dehydrogenase [Pseudomonadota bacterium]
MEILLIGYGAIGREILEQIKPGENANIAGVLVRPQRLEEVRAVLSDRGIEVVSALDDLTVMPQLAAECTGHGGVREFGAEFLRRGVDFLVISIGALADQKLYKELVAAAETGRASLILASGAVAGIDALAAARTGGLQSVTYTSRKPPAAWKGTPAEMVCDLENISQPTTLFEGDAAAAASKFPQNANVAATVALAGAGFSRTEVCLVADPDIASNIHQLSVEGVFGSFDMEIRGKALPNNPKTSMLAAHSVVSELRRRAGVVEIGS